MAAHELLIPGPSNKTHPVERSSSTTTGHGAPSASRIRRRRAITVLASLALIGTAVAGTTGAEAAPRPTISQVQKRIDKLHEQAEQASEDYNTTREQLKSVTVRLRAAERKLARQQVEVARAKAQVGRLAAESYRRGQLSTLDLVLGDDPDMALAQAGYLPSLGERQASAMNLLKDGEQKLAATQSEIQAQQSRAKAAQTAMGKNKDLVNKRLAAANAQLAGLKAGERRQLRQSESSTENQGVPTGGGSSVACAGHAGQAPTAAAATAIRFACDQLGDSYLWAAAGPSRWDCSGLTMKSYAAAGISLPHSSRLQAGYGTRVSTSNLMAGDLVFFHSPISHVGIYLGDGLMIHSPNSGDVVRVASLYATPTVAVRL